MSGSRIQDLFLVSALIALPRLAAADPATTGQWSALKQWPISATHSNLLPTGKMMVFGEWSQGEGPPLLWDPVADTLTSLPAPDYNIFCAGHSFLPDGRLLITGGHFESHMGLPHATIFDPVRLTFSRPPDMNDNRWYPTNTTLANGEVLVTSGETTSAGAGNPLAQVYSATTGGWRDLSNAVFELPYYPRQFVTPSGRVWVVSPSRKTKFLDTEGGGAWIDGPLTLCCTRTYAPAVLRDGKVYLIGGDDPPTATMEVADLAAAEPAWSYLAPMSVARRQHNAVFLPDGRILVAGGSSADGFNNEAGAVFASEVYDPAANSWTTWASAADFHGYHSTAVLLPDGRVFLGGGRGKKGVEIFSPPYLFQGGTRPSMSSAPSQVVPGQRFVIGTPDAARVRKVSLIAPGTVTHSFDEGSRFITLAHGPAAGGIEVTAPANNNLAPPGPYFLFLVDDRGVPSLGRVVTVLVQPPATRKAAVFSDVWKYNDQGLDPGASWMQPAFDDAPWPSGPGQLGYGEADEATKLVKRSPVQPSYYFRKKVTLSQSVSAATIEVLHDDGVAVWVNGVQVFSSGMGHGTGYASWADAPVSNKLSRCSLDLTAVPLQLGQNTIAVLVKQVSATSSDVSFALQMETSAGPVPDAIVLRAPNGGERFSVGSSTSITWGTSGSSRATVDLSLSLDGGATWSPIASGVPNTGSYAWTVPDVPSTLAMVRASSDTAPAISDRSDAVFSISRTVRQTVVALGGTWKYEDSGLDPGPSWNSAAYNDSGWRSGAGQLGYGDGDEATALIRTSLSQSSVYFRKSVDIAGMVTAADVQVLFDDGVAIYVNGVLALTRNMDEGLAHANFASASAENRLDTATLSPLLFVSGRNVIAVMVKQVGKSSPDVSFDLRLDVEATTGVVPLQVVAPDGGEVLFANQVFEITWSGGQGPATASLALSTNGGGNWAPIASGVPNNGVHGWSVPALSTTLGMVRVSTDAQTDESDAPFTIDAASQSRAISYGDVWKYQDSGSDPGAGWSLKTYNDAAWRSGSGQLGYGDGDETTTLRKTSPAQTSVYFRKAILVSGAVSSADLRVLFDDAVAVYVNGQQVFARNMDRGTEHARYASASTENEEALATIPGTAFVVGTNEIGVMVKQVGKTSPDLSFDLQLDVNGAP